MLVATEYLVHNLLIARGGGLRGGLRLGGSVPRCP